MTESAFDAQVRLALHRAYFPLGAFWSNKTGYADSHHVPFCGSGSGDIIGCVMGLWIEIENKTKTGRISDAQRRRSDLLSRLSGLYVVCRECGVVTGDPDDLGFVETRMIIDNHVCELLGSYALDTIVAHRKGNT